MDYKKLLKTKFPYFSDEEVELIVNRAKSILVEQLYPDNLTINYESYEVSKRFEMWIYDCCVELIERDGCSSYTSYSENGISKNFGRAGVSSALLERIPRVAGAIQ